MTNYGKIKHVVIDGERIGCRFPAELWEKIQTAMANRHLNNYTELIKHELYAHFAISPPNEKILLETIRQNAPLPSSRGRKKTTPEPKISTVIVDTLRDRL